MFPRRERLPRKAFSALSGAKRRTNEHFTALIPRQGAGYAVVIAKKTLPRSVDRHLLKRRVLGALRRLPARPPSLILYPKAKSLTLSGSALQETLGDLLQ